MKLHVAEYDHLVLKGRDQRLKGRVMQVGRATIPGNDQAQLIDEVTQFDADDPAMVG